MKSREPLPFAVWLVMIAATVAWVAPRALAAEMSRTQLITLIMANEERYQSFAAKLDMSLYDIDEGQNEAHSEARIQGQTIVRYSDGRSFTQSEVRHMVNGRWVDRAEMAKVLVTSPTWQKSIVHRGKDLVATIGPPVKRNPRSNCELRNYIWDFYGVAWEDMAKDDTLAYSKTESGLWRIERTAENKNTKVRWVAFVDPGKDYLPVRYELHKNGVLRMYQEMANHQVVDGLPFPTEFRFVTLPFDGNGLGNKGFSQVTRATDLKINQRISPSELDYVLPAGTVVLDRIAGTEYMVGRAPDIAKMDERPLAPTASPAALGRDSLRKPASDTELGETLNQAIRTMPVAPTPTKTSWRASALLIASSVVGCALLVLGLKWVLKRNGSSC